MPTKSPADYYTTKIQSNCDILKDDAVMLNFYPKKSDGNPHRIPFNELNKNFQS